MKTKSPAKAFGVLLSEKMQSDPDFYLISPDETTSNKIDAVYGQTTRVWGDLAVEKWDMPESATGRIIELLSENVLFSTMVGKSLILPLIFSVPVLVGVRTIMAFLINRQFFSPPYSPVQAITSPVFSRSMPKV